MQSPIPTTETWRIGVDIGGTFTDLVLSGTRSGLQVFKTPSTPDDPARGVFNALSKAAAALGTSEPALLAACSHFVHGTTIATNTVLEGKGAKTGLLVTEGFRDSLEIRRGLRDNVWDQRSPWPPVLVPRHLRLPVRERTLKTGAIETAVCLSDLAPAIERFRAAKVEAVAVAFINSFLNPENERVAARHLAEALPDCFISVSADLAAVIGEYERTSTAVVNATIAPRVLPYMRDLDAKLRQMGLPGRLLLIQSNGGAVSVERVAERPVSLLLSGPAAGVGALAFYAEANALDDLITMEIGGTSCDVMMMQRGQVAETSRLDIAGYPALTPSVEINTVGTGGGTVAEVDGGGMLRVGPEGAGADPGPASYGLGGERPTVTDAQLLLGRLHPGSYADGSMTLDAGLARDAIRRHVAEPLGLGVEEAAIGMIRLADQNVLHALEQISSEKGARPADFTLVPCGGAGALHGAAVARLLGCRRVFIPKLAGVFCAFGMCNSDIRHDAIQSVIADLSTLTIADIEKVNEARALELREALLDAGFEPDDILRETIAHLRYRGQQWTVSVPFDPEVATTEDLRARFEARFTEIYGYAQPEGVVELVSLQLVLRGRFPPVVLDPQPETAALPEPASRRRVWVDAGHGFQDLPIYGSGTLLPGASLMGPAIVEEETTTILVGARDRLSVDANGNYLIVVSESGGLLE